MTMQQQTYKRVWAVDNSAQAALRCCAVLVLLWQLALQAMMIVG